MLSSAETATTENTVPQRIGYVREHCFQQHQDQLLANARVAQIFAEAADDPQRPQLKAMLDSLQPGDTVVADSMHQLARSMNDLRRIVQIIGEKGAHTEFIQEQLAFDNSRSLAVTFILSVVAAALQFAKTLSRQRTATAQRRLKRPGRTKALSPTQAQQLRQQLQQGTSKTQLAREWGISRQTLYQYLNAQA